jgi:hypothetical protein
MATLAPSGHVDVATVDREVARLTRAWHGVTAADRVTRALGDRAATLDRFDRAQLEDVLAVCAHAPSLSDAGRQLFAASRARRTTTNDADRLRKYLARFELTWDQARGAAPPVATALTHARRTHARRTAHARTTHARRARRASRTRAGQRFATSRVRHITYDADRLSRDGRATSSRGAGARLRD